MATSAPPLPLPSCHHQRSTHQTKTVADCRTCRGVLRGAGRGRAHRAGRARRRRPHRARLLRRPGRRRTHLRWRPVLHWRLLLLLLGSVRVLRHLRTGKRRRARGRVSRHASPAVHDLPRKGHTQTGGESPCARTQARRQSLCRLPPDGHLRCSCWRVLLELPESPPLRLLLLLLFRRPILLRRLRRLRAAAVLRRPRPCLRLPLLRGRRPLLLLRRRVLRVLLWLPVRRRCEARLRRSLTGRRAVTGVPIRWRPSRGRVAWNAVGRCSVWWRRAGGRGLSVLRSARSLLRRGSAAVAAARRRDRVGARSRWRLPGRPRRCHVTRWRCAVRWRVAARTRGLRLAVRSRLRSACREEHRLLGLQEAAKGRKQPAKLPRHESQHHDAFPAQS